MNTQQAWADALLDPAKDCPVNLTSWNGSSPAQRFAVYRNNVTASLIDALADTFPATQALVGETFFRAMAREFIRSQPPGSPLLASYGQAFPDFMTTFFPAARLPYLADVGRLEFAYVEAFHAADATAVSTSDVARMVADSEQLPGLKLYLHPALHVVRSAYAIVSLWAMHHAHSPRENLDWRMPENAWIVRNALRVYVLRMQTEDCAFVEALGSGLPLGHAVAAAQAVNADFDLAACLSILLREQLITGFVLAPGEHHAP